MGSLREVSSSEGLQHPNIYCKPVPPGWDEARLHDFFVIYGDIDSVRISSAAPGSRLGNAHCFVRYNKIESAAAALNGLQGTLIDGIPITVKLADSDMAPRIQSGLCASEWVYVRGLPPHLTKDDLVALFLQFGPVKDLKHFPSTESYKGSGALVQYEHSNEAGNAITALNGSMLPGSGQPLLVRFADSPAEKAAKAARKDRVISRATDPNSSMNEMFLREQIQRQLLELSLQGDGNANAALASLIQGGGLQPGAMQDTSGGWASGSVAPILSTAGSGSLAKLPLASGCSIYIKGLPEDADKLWMYEKFSRFGGILSVRVLVDEQSGRCNGIGFVNFTDAESARAAHETMNGVNMGSRLLHVMVQTSSNASGNMNNMRGRMPGGMGDGGLSNLQVQMGGLTPQGSGGLGMRSVNDYMGNMQGNW